MNKGTKPDDMSDKSAEPAEGAEPLGQGEAVEAGQEERIEPLGEDVEELTGQNAVLLDSLKRLKADFDNYRKRMVREQTHILETAEADLIRKLLPVIDNLQRAVQSARDTESAGLAEGVTRVLELMIDILEREGLEVIDPDGEPFDPEHHEAMMVVETDECPEDTVTEVVQKGYRFSGVLLRPAMVRVSCPVKR